jgi:hypothetical protein
MQDFQLVVKLYCECTSSKRSRLGHAYVTFATSCCANRPEVAMAVSRSNDGLVELENSLLVKVIATTWIGKSSKDFPRYLFQFHLGICGHFSDSRLHGMRTKGVWDAFRGIPTRRPFGQDLPMILVNPVVQVAPAA